MAFSVLRRTWTRQNIATISKNTRRLMSSHLPVSFRLRNAIQCTSAFSHTLSGKVLHVRSLASDNVQEIRGIVATKGCEVPNEHVDSSARSINVGEDKCSGCGSLFQSDDPNLSGYLPEEKLSASSDDSSPQENEASDDEFDKRKEERRAVICQRCFSLMHYNTALDITLKADDYLKHLAQLRDKKALVLLMIDVIDFPGSLFPNLDTLISPDSTVVIVGNKVDLFPKGLKPHFWKRLEGFVREECLKSSLSDCEIAGMHFISAKLGTGVAELSQAIVKYWGNRGDVYLLGCTNVGKSTLFNKLLVELCGATPGELSAERSSPVPAATISQWPGTTLGLLSFPIMSTGKRLRLAGQEKRRQSQADYTPPEDDVLEAMAFKEEGLTPRQARAMASEIAQQNPEEEAVLREIGLRGGHRTEQTSPHHTSTQPQDRFWLYDTPGAINDAQLINLLTTKELKLALPKKAIRPQTFILKPGQCLFIGGLARLDYHEGSVSAYFTVYATSYLPIHTTKISRADDVYALNLGTPLLKIPSGSEERMSKFPPLKFQPITVTGLSWKESVADIVLSSAGWVSVTIGAGHTITLLAYTPLGRGIHCRQPALFPEHVSKRGKRSQKGDRTSFTKRKKK